METRLAKKKAAKVDKKQLCSSSTYLLELPIKRLQQFLAAVVPEHLDPILTSELDKYLLCRLLWLVAQLKANMLVSKFQCTNYKEATLKVVTHNKRVRKIMGEATYNEMVSKLIDLSPANIEAMTTGSDFNPEWLDLTIWKKKGKGPRNQPSNQTSIVAWTGVSGSNGSSGPPPTGVPQPCTRSLFCCWFCCVPMRGGAVLGTRFWYTTMGQKLHRGEPRSRPAPCQNPGFGQNCPEPSIF